MQFTSMLALSQTLHDPVFAADMKLLPILDSSWLGEGAGCKGVDILGQQSSMAAVTALTMVLQQCYEAVIRLLVV